jgi:maleylacetoacetate isomerase
MALPTFCFFAYDLVKYFYYVGSSMTNAKPVLYSYWRSSCSWRVRIALNWKGIDYDVSPVNLLKDEQNSAEYREKNPRGLVPALTVHDVLLTESIAIIEYLEEKYHGRSLLPGNAEKRAKIRSFALMIASNTQPLQNLCVLKKVAGEEEKGKRIEWAKHWINLSFEALEKEMSVFAGKYSFGDEVTLADVCLVPQVYNAKRFQVDLSKFPTIERVEKALSELPEFQKAHPNNQPDTPESEKDQ